MIQILFPKLSYELTGLCFKVHKDIGHFASEKQYADAFEKLLAKVVVTATVIRDNKKKEIPLKNIVPKDIILLSAGDIIPAECQIVESNDFFVLRLSSSLYERDSVRDAFCELKKYADASLEEGSYFVVKVKNQKKLKNSATNS
jgi:hypothetical protein